ncbi:MAG: hypothetical protein R3Y11_06600 [Pseudomonadota bacterium]
MNTSINSRFMAEPPFTVHKDRLCTVLMRGGSRMVFIPVMLLERKVFTA